MFVYTFATLIILTQPSVFYATMSVSELTAKFDEIIDNFSELFNRMDHNLTKKREEKLFMALDRINLEIKITERQLHPGLIKLLNKLPQEVRQELHSHDIQTKQSFIDYYFSLFEQHVRDFDEFEKSTLVQFCDGFVSNSLNSVRFLMQAIYNNVAGDEFLKVFQTQFEPKTSLFCNENYSQQEALHQLLNEILFTNFKSYVLEQSAYLIKKHNNQGNYAKESEFSYTEFLSRSYNITKIFKKYMSEASREVWKCDPWKHIRNETFVEITNFLHGFILNKANLNHRGQCRDECSEYKMVTKPKNCEKNAWCKKQTTCSKIIDCQYVDSSMTVCSSIMAKHNRRYDYVQLGDGRTLGTKKSCNNGNTEFLETYNSWLIWRCSYCFCLCDEGPKYFSDRYINLRLSMSNISDNKVVTGLRFVKHNQIIHLQVQEGKLLGRGIIDPDSIRWIPPENYTRLDRYIHEGQDYQVITWEKRSIELTEIMAKNGSVVTGVRFKKIGSRLELEIMTTPFNFTTGKLRDNPDQSSIFEEAPNIHLRHRFGKEIILSSPDVPTRTTAPSTHYTTGKYIQFTATDVYKDAAQTTVPFFDSRQVYTKHPGPLSGVGLFHRGRKGSGGFIAPKIFTYDFSQHL